MKLSTSIAFALCLNLATTGVFANDEEDDSGFSFDDKLASCATCHGENGDKPLAPDYPILAGQYGDYLEAALKDYRSGRRKNPIMSMQVEMLKLTDGDIEKLAAYFSSKKGLKNLGE